MEQQINLYQPILGAEKPLFSAAASGLGLALMLACLAGLAGYCAWRTRQTEFALVRLERQEDAALAHATRASVVLRPTRTLAQLDAEASNMTAEITARDHALALVREGSGAPATGFAARLEALARRQLDGVWLSHIVVGSGDGRLALRGGTSDPHLVPVYLSALAAEHAFEGVRFDRLILRRALPGEAPAQMVFELGAPGLKFAAREPGT
jgi:hypothetical protein